MSGIVAIIAIIAIAGISYVAYQRMVNTEPADNGNAVIDIDLPDDGGNTNR